MARINYREELINSFFPVLPLIIQTYNREVKKVSIAISIILQSLNNAPSEKKNRGDDIV